jgi:hypothetical protein
MMQQFATTMPLQSQGLAFPKYILNPFYNHDKAPLKKINFVP